MKRILHINFDVYKDSKVSHKVGGVPCAIQNIINYLSTVNKHNLLTLDSSIKDPVINNGNYIFPNLNKSYFSSFLRSPLRVFWSFKDVDIFVFHHLPPLKVLMLFRILFPFRKIFCFVYTKQSLKFERYLSMIDLFVTTDTILQSNLLEVQYPKNKLKAIGVIPDIDYYDIQKNKIPFDFFSNNSKIWYSAGPRKEMGYEVFVNEILQDVEKRNNYRITLLGESEVKVGEEIRGMSNVEIGKMYTSVPEAMAGVDVMAYLITDHMHKMHMPLMALESLLMKRVVISTLSGGMPCLFNDKNCIPVQKDHGFLEVYKTYSRQDLLNLVEQGYKDAKDYSNRVINEMEEIFL